MRATFQSSQFFKGAAGTVAVLSLLFLCMNAGFASHSTVSYVPGIAITPDVLLTDGVTPRTYQTPAGLSYWTSDLPVQRGDKIKLNVFVATGGADLKRMIVRLDNVKIADLSTSPWNTVIDTSTLQPGYHMVEAWAQGSGDRPQSSTKTLTFYLVDALPVVYAVKASQELFDKRTMATTAATPEDAPMTPPSTYLPAFLAGRETDTAAAVTIRSDDTAVESELDRYQPLSISSSALLYFRPAPGSDAVEYAYVLVRDDHVIAASTSPQSMDFEKLRLRARTDVVPGLRSGRITLYAWGIDQIGRPSTPIQREVIIGQAEGQQ